MIKLIAWVVGVCAAVAIYTGFNVLLKIAEIPTYIDFGETITVKRGSGLMSYDEDIDGESTTAGVLIFILSIMMASRIGMAISNKDILGGLDQKGEIEFRSWFFGLSLMLAGTSIMSYVRDGFVNQWYIDALSNISEIALAGYIFIFIKKRRNRRLRALAEEMQRGF